MSDIICGEVALAYQNGREAGYDDGFEDGVELFAKYLKENSFECDCNVVIFDAIDTDDLDDMVKEFLKKDNIDR